ncbi:MAG: hypothetical protein HOL85_03580 [Rhodospirillaceae bacterium]|jgi:hypothetical protein|nr:hypothetical protein [Rhodospirillaceae bacterium]MBT6140229.1 hypothetical protein [Rhodospirillaceae bacterium]
MSLSAALKAGLGFDSTENETEDTGWNPYPEDQDNKGSLVSSTPQDNAAGKAVAKVPARSRATAAPAPANINQATSPRAPAPRSKTNAKAEAQAAKIPAQAKRPRATARQANAEWLGDSDTKRAVNPQQYVRELERFLGDQNRKETRDAVLNVTSTEIEGVASLAARIRGRYLAKLLDTGNSSDVGLREGELRELIRYRESHEELLRGLELIKGSIQSGDITVTGMVRR